MRAEVGLLSRNVRVIGTRDQQWSDEIEACPDGFDTGQLFLTNQTQQFLLIKVSQFPVFQLNYGINCPY